jgi:hypothetical protein
MSPALVILFVMSTAYRRARPVARPGYSNSAICTAFSAAPLRMLSETIQR